MGDGVPVEISWKPGTDIIKRIYVKNMIKNMEPVRVINTNNTEDIGREYVLYFNKYEFCRRDFNVVSDAPLNWFNLIFFCGRKPKVDLSYRECRLIIDKIFDLSGVRFDIPTIQEWESARGNAIPDYRNEDDYYSVRKGIANEFGLHNINANAPEYTSNYLMNYSISLDAEKELPSFDYVWISGIVDCGINKMAPIYKAAHSFDYYPTFRLVYRPRGIGARNFIIKGFLREDVSCDTLPTTIRLLSLNGKRVHDIPDYETFEELVMESRYDKKQITAIDIITQSYKSLTLPKGIELYDFYPAFWFEGCGSEE